MSMIVKGGAIAAVLVSLAGPVAGVTVQNGQAKFNHQTQGQRFYSGMVSRVTNGEAQACMVSTGSDWHKTGIARRAGDVSRMIGDGATLQSALADTVPVDLRGLSSNTPYLAFVIGQDGDKFVRFATGFHMAQDSVEVTYGARTVDGLRVENRGDTGVFRDADTVDEMFSAFMAGDTFKIAARSVKTSNKEPEHYIQYQFEGQDESSALATCLADMNNRENTLHAGRQPFLSLKPIQNSDLHQRMTARAMACNRELDPNETEVMQLDGDLLGFTSPLAYALVSRDRNGDIEDIWSGDLWRISKRVDGFEAAFSNSITKQGPLDAQDTKACTRFGDAMPVSVIRNAEGGLSVEPSFERLLSSVEPIYMNSGIQQIGRSIAASSNGGSVSPLTVRKVSSVGTRTASSTQALTGTPLLTNKSVSSVVTQTTKTPGSPNNPTDNVNAVPIPAAGILLAGALFGISAIFGRRKRSVI